MERRKLTNIQFQQHAMKNLSSTVAQPSVLPSIKTNIEDEEDIYDSQQQKQKPLSFQEQTNLIPKSPIHIDKKEINKKGEKEEKKEKETEKKNNEENDDEDDICVTTTITETTQLIKLSPIKKEEVKEKPKKEENEVDSDFEEINSDEEPDYFPKTLFTLQKSELNYEKELEKINEELKSIHKSVKYDNEMVIKVIKEIENEKKTIAKKMNEYKEKMLKEKNTRNNEIKIPNVENVVDYYQMNINKYKKWLETDSKLNTKEQQLSSSSTTTTQINKNTIKKKENSDDDDPNGIILDTIDPNLYRIKLTTENIKKVYIIIYLYIFMNRYVILSIV